MDPNLETSREQTEESCSIQSGQGEMPEQNTTRMGGEGFISDTETNLTTSWTDTPVPVEQTKDVSEGSPSNSESVKTVSPLPNETLGNCEDIQKGGKIQTETSTSVSLSRNKKRKGKGDGHGKVKRRNVSKEIPETVVEEGKRVMLPRRVGIEWKPGARLEALDFLKNWYSSRIVTINPQDMKVRVHFDGWNSKFDQWIDMRSDRLRPFTPTKGPYGQLSSKLASTELKVGQIVLAKWSSSKYPAKVKEQRSRGGLTIEFYDGVDMQTDVTSVRALPKDLQSEALYIWETMKELTETSKNLASELSKSSRRESLEVNRIQQTRVEKVEAMLTQLIEKASLRAEEGPVSNQAKAITNEWPSLKDSSRGSKGSSRESKDSSHGSKGSSGESKDSSREPKDSSRGLKDSSRGPKDSAREPKDSSKMRKDRSQGPKVRSQGPGTPKPPASRPSSRNTDTMSVTSGDGLPSTSSRLKSVDGVHVNDLILVRGESDAPLEQLALVQRVLYKKRLAVIFYNGLERTVYVSDVQRLHDHQQSEALKLWHEIVKLREDNDRQRLTSRSSAHSETKSKLASLERLLQKLIEKTSLSSTSKVLPADLTSFDKSGGDNLKDTQSGLKSAITVESSSLLKADSSETSAAKERTRKTTSTEGKSVKTGTERLKRPAGIKIKSKSKMLNKSKEQDSYAAVRRGTSDKANTKKRAVLVVRHKRGRPRKADSRRKKSVKSKPDTRRNRLKILAAKSDSSKARVGRPLSLTRNTIKSLSDAGHAEKPPATSRHRQRESTHKSSKEERGRPHRHDHRSAKTSNQQPKHIKQEITSQSHNRDCADAKTAIENKKVKCLTDEEAKLEVTEPECLVNKPKRLASPLYAANKKKGIQLHKIKNSQKLLMKRKAVRHKSTSGKKSRPFLVKMFAGQSGRQRKTVDNWGSKQALVTPSKSLRMTNEVSVVLTPTSRETIDAHRKLDVSEVEPESLPPSTPGEETLRLDESLDSDLFNSSTNCDKDEQMNTEDSAMINVETSEPAEQPLVDSLASLESLHCKGQLSVKLSPLQLSRLLRKESAANRQCRSQVSVQLEPIAVGRCRSADSKSASNSERHAGDTGQVRGSGSRKVGKINQREMRKAVVNLEKTDMTSLATSSRSSTRVADMELARKAVETSKNMPVGYTVILERADARPSKAFTVNDDQSQYKCHHCQKCFRKESLLTSHIKYNHNSGSTVGQTPQPARKGRSKSSNATSVERNVPSSVHPRTMSASSAASRHETVPDGILLDSSTLPTGDIEVRPSDSMPAQKLSSTSTPLASPSPSISAVRSPQAVSQAKAVETDDCDSESVADSDYQTEVVNCMCGYNEEDNLMIQCDFCCCWQHSECFGIDPKSLPDPYLCYVCLDTPGVRESSRVLYNHNWRRHGMLPKLDGSPVTAEDHKVADIMKRSQQERVKLLYQLSALASTKRLLDSASNSDAYELALWSPEEEEISPVSLDPIPTNVMEKENLLLRVQQSHNDMERCLMHARTVVRALEAEAGINPLSIEENATSTSKNLNTLVRDMSKVKLLNRLSSV